MSDTLQESVDRLERELLPMLDEFEKRILCPKPNKWGKFAADLRAVIAAQKNMAQIEYLRNEEGDLVTILCDNPEGLPNNAVECSGDWTKYNNKRFEGETLHAALEAAVAAKRLAISNRKW